MQRRIEKNLLQCRREITETPCGYEIRYLRRASLTDARKASPASPPQAEFEVSEGNTRKTVTWIYGARCRELAGIHVFDGTSVAAHLTRANSISFAPAGLALLTRLVDVTDAVRGLVRTIIGDLQAPHQFSQFYIGDSPVSFEVANLSADSNVEALEDLAQLSGSDEGRMGELDKDISVLKFRSVPQRIASLRQEVSDLEALLTNVGSTAAVVSADATAEIAALIQNFQIRRDEASRVGADQFRFALFTQIGTDVWRAFLQSAKALADAEGDSRGAIYPQENDACLLCRQRLGPDALDLINRMWNFLSSDAQSQFEQAREACHIREKVLQTASLAYFGADTPARRVLQAEVPEVVAELEAYIVACSARTRELHESLSTATIREVEAVTGPRTEMVQRAIDRRKEQIDDLEKMDAALELNGLQNELRQLQHKRTLSEKLPAIKVWIDEQRMAAQALREALRRYLIS